MLSKMLALRNSRVGILVREWGGRAGGLVLTFAVILAVGLLMVACTGCAVIRASVAWAISAGG